MLNYVLNIKEFDLSKMVKNPAIVIIGDDYIKKSYLIKNLLCFFKDIQNGILITKNQHFYNNINLNVSIYNNYDSSLVKNLFKHQEQIISKYNTDVIKYNNTNLIKSFIIVDDLLNDLFDDKSFVNDKEIARLFINGRCYNIMFVVSMKYLLLPPALRDNIDYVFILKNSRLDIRKKLYEQYAGMLPNFEVFSQLLDNNTKNNECLVIDNKKNKITDMVYKYNISINDNDDNKIN